MTRIDEINKILDDMPKTSVADITQYLKQFNFEDDGCGNANWENVSYIFVNPDRTYSINVSVNPFLNTLNIYIYDESEDFEIERNYKSNGYKNRLL